MKKQFVVDDEIVDVEVVEESASFVLFNFEGEEYSVNLGPIFNGKMILNMKGKNRPVILIDAPRRSRKQTRSIDHGQMKSPMPGKILKILVKIGDVVAPGTPILVMEAMKMEHTIKASKAGTIEKIYFKEGDQVAGGVELVNVK
jgi:biotin carboxyl carrier protein